MASDRARWGGRFGLVATAAVTGVLTTLLTAPAGHAAETANGAPCPAPESVVPGAIWHNDTLAPGVQLFEGSITDDGGHGLVKMHVLRIDVAQPGVALRPLMRSVAARTPLSQLAAGHKRLVAATNTGYFDFATGAPTQPLIVGSKPVVASAHPQAAFGLDSEGVPQWGTVSLVSKVSVGGQSHQLEGLNDVDVAGLETFDSAWGTSPIAVQSRPLLARSVVGGRLGAAITQYPESVEVPENGYELVADGTADRWLARQPAAAEVHITTAIVTTAPHPFAQAYGVGTAIVTNGVARTGLACSSAGTTQPARTAIGIADKDKTLVIGEVEDHPGTNLHGLDEDQMGAFMAQLGVERAWDLDGSGSTELLARMPGTRTLSRRTYPADGQERPMPVGLGITYHAPSRTKSAK